MIKNVKIEMLRMILSSTHHIEPITDDILYMRNDHNDGIWINPSLWVRKKQKTRTRITRKRKRLT